MLHTDAIKEHGNPEEQDEVADDSIDTINSDTNSNDDQDSKELA